MNVLLFSILQSCPLFSLVCVCVCVILIINTVYSSYTMVYAVYVGSLASGLPVSQATQLPLQISHLHVRLNIPTLLLPPPADNKPKHPQGCNRFFRSVRCWKCPRAKCFPRLPHHIISFRLYHNGLLAPYHCILPVLLTSYRFTHTALFAQIIVNCFSPSLLFFLSSGLIVSY